MRTTSVRYVTHMGLQFKAHWLIHRKVKVSPTSAESILSAKGIEICDPQQLLKPAIIEEPFTPPETKSKFEQKKLQSSGSSYIFKNSFQPIAGMQQCQLLTNSVYFEQLPESVMKEVQGPTEEDEQLIKEIAIQAHLTDAKQNRLPLVLDVHKHPGYKPPRSYGIPNNRKISNLVHKILLHVNENSHRGPFYFLEDVSSAVTLPHSGKSIHMNHKAKVMACSRTPLKPYLPPDTIGTLLDTPMPDIFPLSPFVHARSEPSPTSEDGFAVNGGLLAPHTIVVSADNYLFQYQQESFAGIAMLHGFSHASAYARDKLKAKSDTLESPVTVNVIHTNGQYIQIGCFQLNTLDLSSTSMRNVCWLSPCEKLYEKVAFESAKPVVHDVNAKPLALLKALF